MWVGWTTTLPTQLLEWAQPPPFPHLVNVVRSFSSSFLEMTFLALQTPFFFINFPFLPWLPVINVAQVEDMLNLISGSKVTAKLLNMWIFLLVELRPEWSWCRLQSRLVALRTFFNTPRFFKVLYSNAHPRTLILVGSNYNKNKCIKCSLRITNMLFFEEIFREIF